MLEVMLNRMNPGTGRLPRLEAAEHRQSRAERFDADYLRDAQAYMLISMPIDTSTIFGVFQLIRFSQKVPIKACRKVETSTRNHSWVTRWLSFESQTSLASGIISSLKYDSPCKKRGY